MCSALCVCVSVCVGVCLCPCLSFYKAMNIQSWGMCPVVLPWSPPKGSSSKHPRWIFCSLFIFYFLALCMEPRTLLHMLTELHFQPLTLLFKPQGSESFYNVNNAEKMVVLSLFINEELSQCTGWYLLDFCLKLKFFIGHGDSTWLHHLRLLKRHFGLWDLVLLEVKDDTYNFWWKRSDVQALTCVVLIRI